MSTILQNIENAEYSYDKRIHIKGASEIVLQSCRYYLDENGRKLDLLDEMRSDLLETINSYAKQALRTICFAYKDLRPNDGGVNHEDDDSEGVIKAVEKEDFILIAIVGIKDIIRPEVPKAVKQCQLAGITVRMVTGDNKTTATAIARECGILVED